MNTVEKLDKIVELVVDTLYSQIVEHGVEQCDPKSLENITNSINGLLQAKQTLGAKSAYELEHRAAVRKSFDECRVAYEKILTEFGDIPDNAKKLIDEFMKDLNGLDIDNAPLSELLGLGQKAQQFIKDLTFSLINE